MKITDIKIHILQSNLEVPFAFSQGWVNKRSATLVEVITDEGIVGWGEAFAQGLEAPQIAAAAIEYSLKPLIIGEDPLRTGVLWHKMYNQTRDFGRKGSVMAGISALDIAFWDIAGRVHGMPVSGLLGGAFRSEVRPYATGFYRISGRDEADRLADEAVMHLESGFDTMKVKLGFGVKDDIHVMNAINRALLGHNVELMVDTNHAYGRTEALGLGYALDEFDLRWYEEPVAPEDIDGYAELRSKLSSPIAGGENEHSLYGFRDLIDRHAVDILQPDIGSCGGITAARHIITLAQSKGIEVNPHVWGSAIAQAASLQVIASLPNTNHSIYARQPILEYDQSAHPFRKDLVDAPIRMNADGLVEIPTRPGLGVEVSKETIEKFRVN